MFRKILALVSSNLLLSVIMFLRTILIARLISVADFGIAATFITAVAIMRLVSDLGFDKLLVQHDQGDDPDFQNGLQFFQILRGLANAVALYFLAWPLAWFLEQPDLVWAYQMMALVPLCGGFTHLDAKRLQRRMRFRPQIVSNVLPPLLSLALVWPFYKLFGDYRTALFTILATSALTLVFSHLVAERPYRVRYDRKVLGHGISFGWPLLADGVLLFIIFHGEKLIIGRELGLVALGIFSLGLTLMQSPGGSISLALSQFFLPQLAAHKSEPGAFDRLALISLQANYIAAIGLCTGVVLLGAPVVVLAFGDKYLSVIPLLVWFAISQSLRITKNGTAMVSVARAKTENGLVGNIPRVLSILAAWYLLTQGHGLGSVLACGVLGELAGFLLSVWLLGARVGVALRPLLPSLTAFLGFLTVLAVYGAMTLAEPGSALFRLEEDVVLCLVLLAAGLCLLSFRSFWGYLRARQMLTYD